MNSRYRFLFFFFLLVSSAAQSLAQNLNLGVAAGSPKREFRGAWIATVTNLDWPSTNGLTTDQQKTQLVNLLDQLKATGINAVVFQVRTECDAFYASLIEPWSYWLTGGVSPYKQGIPPAPFYDPLQFAIQETHARGMELHAWFNPYRAVRPSTYTRDTTHVSVRHPDWLLNFPTISTKILDPGLPQVRDYVTSVVMDIVRRYDVDGVHADDYFYPYPDDRVSFPGITKEDDSTYANYSRGITNRGDWRRENVNLLIKEISDSVKAVKPNVKFGMSPFGIWKAGVPTCPTCLNAYSTIYCDALAWLRGRYIDYLAPQLYWSFGGGQDYGLLQPWWADSTNAYGRHLYTGNATYRIGTSFGSASELSNQINFNRGNPKVQGSIQFRANNIRDNIGGWTDLLKSDVFLYPAIIPVMKWKDLIPPNAPQNLRVVQVPSTNLFSLQWDSPARASDGDTAMRYVVYRFTSPTYQPSDLENSKYLIALSGSATTIPSGRIDTVSARYYYAAASLDRNNNESGLSKIVSISSPVTTPMLASPADGELFSRNGMLKWNKIPTALTYKTQVATGPDFGQGSLLASMSTADTFAVVGGLLAQQIYSWRVVAGSQGETSPYSGTRSFKAGWPLPPTLIAPPIARNISRTPTFVWTKSGGTSFEVKVTDNVTRIVVIDTTVSDSTFTSSKALEPFRIYTWVASGSNAYGSSDWSAESRFQTVEVTYVEREGAIPTDYALAQNYPNPFNAATIIRFAIPQSGLTSLKVYDVLGREITTLVHDELAAGTYRFEFNGQNLPSGVYFYRFISGWYAQTKIMQLVK